MKNVSRVADAAGFAIGGGKVCAAASTGRGFGDAAFDLVLAAGEADGFAAAFGFFGATSATVFFAAVLAVFSAVFLAASFAVLLTVFLATFLTFFLTVFLAAFLAFATALPFLARVFFAAALTVFFALFLAADFLPA